MNQTTREFCKGVENACRIAREIPYTYPVSGPEHDFTRELIKTRARFFEQLAGKLPRYQIPETASLFARSLHWPDVEDAHVLPDGRLLVRWMDYTDPEVLTEAAYLSAIALRSTEINYYGDRQRDDIIKSIRAHLRRNP